MRLLLTAELSGLALPDERKLHLTASPTYISARVAAAIVWSADPKALHLVAQAMQSAESAKVMGPAP